MTTLQQLADAMLLIADARRANDWQALQSAAEETARLARVLELDRCQERDELHDLKYGKPFSIGWAANILYGRN